MLAYDVFDTSWGAFGYVAAGTTLVRSYLPDVPSPTLEGRIRDAYPGIPRVPDLLPRFEIAVRAYFDGRRVAFRTPLDLSAVTPFRRHVLLQCRRIPYGRTASYADLACAVGRAGAGRAVGGAMAANPLPLVVPCHRVIRADGSLGGFSSTLGIDQKRRMLEIEARS